MESIGDRIKKGRTLRKLSLRELGDRAGLSHSQISYLEKGERSVTGPVLLSLAEALDLPLDYFVIQSSPTIKGVSYRKIKSLSKGENDMILEMIEHQVVNYLELEEIMNVHTPFNHKLLHGYVIQTTDDIEAVTQAIRQEFKLGQAAIPNVASFLESIGVKVIGIPSKKGFDGVSFMVNDTIPVIAYNTNIESIERQRMTLLHELGHLLVEPLVPDKEGKELEDICTSFANHLLLPSEVVQGYFGGRRKSITMTELIELQGIYGISIDAIIYRLKEMRFISERAYQSYCIEKNMKPQLKEAIEKSRYEEPQSRRFVRMVVRALDSALITQAKAVVYLKGYGIREEEATQLLNSRI